MREGWKMEKLGSHCKTSAGSTPLKSKSEYYENGKIPWLRSGEVGNKAITKAKIKITELALEETSVKMYPEDSVLIAMYGATAGEVGVLRFPSTSNQAVCALYPSKKFVPEFLYYFFLHFKNDLVAQAVGNAQPNISQAKIKNTLIPIIDIIEQKQIVTLLDQAFAAIDQAKANIERNIENAKELFQSKLNAIFSQRGEGWEEKTLGELGKVSMCKRILKKQTTPNGEIPFYKIGTFGKEANAFIPKVIYDEFKNKYSFPNKGDILISASGTIGRRVIYDGLPAYFQDSNIVWIDNNEESVTNDYLYQFYGVCEWNPSRGATISRLYNSDLRKMKISFPSISRQKQIIPKMEKLNKQTMQIESNYNKKLEDLEELKNSILEKAFSGELTGNSAVESK